MSKERVLQIAALITLMLIFVYVFFIPPKEERASYTKTLTQQTYDHAMEWFTQSLNSKGLFVYLYNPVTGRVATSNNELRQLMASRVLAAESAKNETLHVAHQKNLDFIFEHWYRTEGNLGYVLYEDKSKLGANAMLLRTLVYSPRFEAYRTEARALADGILSLQQPDGSFVPWFKEPSYSYDADYLLTFYSGEALLALIEYYERTQDLSLITPIEKSARFYIDQYVTNLDTNYYPAYVPWHTMAYAKLFTQTGDHMYASAIFTLNDKLLELLDTTEVKGRFYNPQTPEYGSPHSSSDAVYLEGLAYAYEVARTVGDTERSNAYRNAITLAVQNIASLQHKEALPMYAAAPHTYLGAIRINKENPSIRIDTTQHTLDALQKLLEVL